MARGDRPADVLLRGGRVADVFTGREERADVALAGPWIAGVGKGYDAAEVVELDGAPIETVREGLEEVLAAARELGSELHDPFMAMSFLGLEVIPSLKITDRGLVDVEAFRLVDLRV